MDIETGTTKEYLWYARKRNALGLPWTFTKYAFTDDRLFITKGFFKTVEDEVRLYRIMDLSLTRTLGQKIFGMGTIKIVSADKTMGDFDLVNIKNPSAIKEQLSQLIEECRDKKRISGHEYMDDEETTEILD